MPQNSEQPQNRKYTEKLQEEQGSVELEQGFETPSFLPENVETPVRSAQLKHLRGSAEIGKFKAVNTAGAAAALLGGLIGFLCGVYLLPPQYYFVIPWPHSGTRLMPPMLLGAGLLGMLLGMTISIAFVMLAWRLRSFNRM